MTTMTIKYSIKTAIIAINPLKYKGTSFFLIMIISIAIRKIIPITIIASNNRNRRKVKISIRLSSSKKIIC